MSVPEQLALVPGKTVEICRCGHDEHIGPCMYGRGTRFGGCTCTRFTPLGFVPVDLPRWLQKPTGAVDVIRQDLKRRKGKAFEQRKVMGWVLVGPHTLLAYLSQLETFSPNVTKQIANSFRFGRITEAKHRQLMAMVGTGEKAQRERAMNVMETAHVQDRGVPKKAIVTRISVGKLDSHDNVRGALKFIVDGIAEGLLLENDRGLGDVTTYEQTAPGKRGIYGVRIEMSWGAP